MAGPQTDFTSRVYRRFYRNLEVLRGQTGPMSFIGANKPLLRTGYSSVPATMQREVSAITSMFKGAEPTYLWKSEQLGVWNTRIPIGGGQDISLLVPRVEKGMLTEGVSQQTRYIAPGIGIFDPVSGELEKMSRSDYLLREIRESVVPDIKSGALKTQKEINRAVQEAKRRTIQTLENVPNLPLEQQTPAMKDYIRTRGQAIDVLVQQKRNVKEGAWKE